MAASSSNGNKSRGRQRVKMVKMENDSNRQVTFSKRRGGLFKKASELCTLCGVEIAIIVFSPGKKSFSFGHPSVEMIINRYMIDSSSNHHECGRCSGSGSASASASGAHSSTEDGVVGELNDEFSMVSNRLEMEKKRCEEISGVKKVHESEDFDRFVTWLEAPMKINRREKRRVAHQVEYVRGMVNELRRKVIIEGRRFMVEFPNVGPSFKGAMDAAAAAAFASQSMAGFDGGPFNGGLGYGGMGF